MEGEKSTTLYCRHGGHDKVYMIRLISLTNGKWITSVLYGRRGKTLREFKPMKQSGTYREADAKFRSLYEAQLDEYTEDSNGRRLTGLPPVITDNDLSDLKPQQARGERFEVDTINPAIVRRVVPKPRSALAIVNDMLRDGDLDDALRKPPKPTTQRKPDDATIQPKPRRLIDLED